MLKDPSVITVDSQLRGKTVTVMAGVHGNEMPGIIALRRIIDAPNITAGKVHFIFANLPAIALGARQTEMNLNRAFRDDLGDCEKDTSEARRAIELMPYLDESEALLDLHTVKNEQATPFIICEEHSLSLAKQLPFSVVVTGLDELHPGGTDNYMNKRGSNGICAECGSHWDAFAPGLALRATRIFLRIMGVASFEERPPVIDNHRHIRVHTIHKTETDFKLAKRFADFEHLTEGQTIGTDGATKITATKASVILFPQNCSDENKEAFVLGEEVPGH